MPSRTLTLSKDLSVDLAFSEGMCILYCESVSETFNVKSH